MTTMFYTKPLFGISLIALLVLSVAFNVYLFIKVPNTAYVDIHKIFNEFQGKKELEAQLLSRTNRKKSILDSMALDIQVLENRIEKEPKDEKLINQYQSKRSQFTQLQQEFQNQHSAQDQQYTDEIWTQINQYIIDYGKENTFDYIYGASGNGALMYGSSEKNITNELLTYINSKYDGA